MVSLQELLNISDSVKADMYKRCQEVLNLCININEVDAAKITKMVQAVQAIQNATRSKTEHDDADFTLTVLDATSMILNYLKKDNVSDFYLSTEDVKAFLYKSFKTHRFYHKLQSKRMRESDMVKVVLSKIENCMRRLKITRTDLLQLFNIQTKSKRGKTADLNITIQSTVESCIICDIIAQFIVVGHALVIVTGRLADDVHRLEALLDMHPDALPPSTFEYAKSLVQLYTETKFKQFTDDNRRALQTYIRQLDRQLAAAEADDEAVVDDDEDEDEAVVDDDEDEAAVDDDEDEDEAVVDDDDNDDEAVVDDDDNDDEDEVEADDADTAVATKCLRLFKAMLKDIDKYRALTQEDGTLRRLSAERTIQQFRQYMMRDRPEVRTISDIPKPNGAQDKATYDQQLQKLKDLVANRSWKKRTMSVVRFSMGQMYAAAAHKSITDFMAEMLFSLLNRRTVGDDIYDAIYSLLLGTWRYQVHTTEMLPRPAPGLGTSSTPVPFPDWAQEDALPAQLHSDYTRSTSRLRMWTEHNRFVRDLERRENVDAICPKDAAPGAPEDRRPFQPQKQQIIIAKYTEDRPWWRSLLLYWKMGSGKTCAAVSIIQQYRRHYPDNRVVIILPANLRQNMITALFRECGTDFEAPPQLNATERHKLRTKLRTKLNMGEADPNDEEWQVDEIVYLKNRYNIHMYSVAGFQIAYRNMMNMNRVDNLTINQHFPQSPYNALQTLLGNSLVVVDELHTLLNSSISNHDMQTVLKSVLNGHGMCLSSREAASQATLFKIARFVACERFARPLYKRHDFEATKFLLLTGTPLFDRIDQYENLMHLVNPYSLVVAPRGPRKTAAAATRATDKEADNATATLRFLHDNADNFLRGLVSYFAGPRREVFPNLHHCPVYVPMTAPQLELLEKLRQEAKDHNAPEPGDLNDVNLVRNLRNNTNMNLGILSIKRRIALSAHGDIAYCTLAEANQRKEQRLQQLQQQVAATKLIGPKAPKAQAAAAAAAAAAEDQGDNEADPHDGVVHDGDVNPEDGDDDGDDGDVNPEDVDDDLGADPDEVKAAAAAGGGKGRGAKAAKEKRPSWQYIVTNRVLKTLDPSQAKELFPKLCKAVESVTAKDSSVEALATVPRDPFLRKGKHIMYSFFIDTGIVVMTHLLSTQGFTDVTKDAQAPWVNDAPPRLPGDDYRRFVVISQALSPAKLLRQRENVFRLLNSSQNVDGRLVKVIVASSVIMHGVNFKHIQYMHILDPQWNVSARDQLQARAARFCSHNDIPAAAADAAPFTLQPVGTSAKAAAFTESHIRERLTRDVVIYDYIAQLPDHVRAAHTGRPANHSDQWTIDEHMIRILQSKENGLRAGESMLKEVAIDRLLYPADPDAVEAPPTRPHGGDHGPSELRVTQVLQYIQQGISRRPRSSDHVERYIYNAANYPLHHQNILDHFMQWQTDSVTSMMRYHDIHAGSLARQQTLAREWDRVAVMISMVEAFIKINQHTAAPASLQRLRDIIDQIRVTPEGPLRLYVALHSTFKQVVDEVEHANGDTDM